MLLLLSWSEHAGKDIISTAILQMPVDCVMAGDQEDHTGEKKSPLAFKPGRAHYGALRRIFRE